MREKYSEEVIAHSIRRSLRGEAALVLMRLGPQANISDIIEKFESIYGTVDKKQMLLSKFYSAKQDVNEDVKSWGCRLEDLLSKVQAVDKIAKPEADQMLKDIFWEGLKHSLKDATGHIYDKQLPYDQLLKEIRKKEEDVKKRDAKEHTQSLATNAKTEIDEIKEMIQNLNTDVKQVKDELSTNFVDNPDQYINAQQYSGFRKYGHTGQRYGNAYTPGRFNLQGQRRNFGGRRQRGHGRIITPNQRDTSGYMHSTPKYTESGEPICMRCGQEGHLALGCRVRLDHSRQALNFNRPTSRRGR
ncbi:hypothetical protein FSP39_023583 [Pinctada imbricata]|uniref:CCHC-type domain-containing protein n=1 Tax=Pinctada imbricata TaxID=66713 RepID=A0AA89C494_PINIB|nr:hypothetical protein FSP39_023583 [Pinctada imbricata]